MEHSVRVKLTTLAMIFERKLLSISLRQNTYIPISDQMISFKG